MALLPQTPDPTLEAADRALEAAQERRHRPYLGMSAIGGECPRALWYSFRWARQATFDAPTLKRFEDGHATEAVAVARLGATPGLEVHALDEQGQQFGFRDIGGHFRGHMDGVVLGLIQAPKTWHVLEIKATADPAKLDKAKAEVGEKLALRRWNPTYYAQAVLYMDYAGLDRHYLVACTPGARGWTSVRTNADPVEAERLKEKAERIIHAPRPPERIGGPDCFACRWCDFASICHDPTGDGPERNCRTCMHATPEIDGGWSCARWAALDLDVEQQRVGCPKHLFIPDLVPFEQIDAAEDRITYRRADGALWIDGAEA